MCERSGFASHPPRLITSHMQILLFTGSGFGSVATDVTVFVNDSACIVDSASDSSITCTLGAHPAGTFGIEVIVADKGLASGAYDFEYELALVSLSAMEGNKCFLCFLLHNMPLHHIKVS